MKLTNQLPNSSRSAEPGVINCVWMDAGVVDYKLCDRNLDCDHCPFDEALHGQRADYSRTSESLRLQGCEVERGLFYHPTHIWMRVEEGGEVRTGLDDFGQRLFGAVYSLQLPPPEAGIKRGEACCRLALQSGLVTLFSPVSGRVKETNTNLALSPSHVNRDPYGSGWLMLVEPTDLEACLKRSFYGPKAGPWLAGEIEKLRLLINNLTNQEPTVPITLNDGGQLTAELLRGLSVEQSRRIISSFFPFSSSDETQNKPAIVIPDGR